MKTKCLITFAVFFGLLLSAPFAAAQGTAFDYQGNLTDNNLPSNATYDLNFVLFDAASGGSVIGSAVTKNNVQVSGGVFTVSLDFGSTAFDGSPRWLEIAARASGTFNPFNTLAPRQPEIGRAHV